MPSNRIVPETVHKLTELQSVKKAVVSPKKSLHNCRFPHCLSHEFNSDLNPSDGRYKYKVLQRYYIMQVKKMFQLSYQSDQILEKDMIFNDIIETIERKCFLPGWEKKLCQAEIMRFDMFLLENVTDDIPEIFEIPNKFYLSEIEKQLEKFTRHNIDISYLVKLESNYKYFLDKITLRILSYLRTLYHRFIDSKVAKKTHYNFSEEYLLIICQSIKEITQGKLKIASKLSDYLKDKIQETKYCIDNSAEKMPDILNPEAKYAIDMTKNASNTLFNLSVLLEEGSLKKIGEDGDFLKIDYKGFGQELPQILEHFNANSSTFDHSYKSKYANSEKTTYEIIVKPKENINSKSANEFRFRTKNISLLQAMHSFEKQISKEYKK